VVEKKLDERVTRLTVLLLGVKETVQYPTCNQHGKDYHGRTGRWSQRLVPLAQCHSSTPPPLPIILERRPHSTADVAVSIRVLTLDNAKVILLLVAKALLQALAQRYHGALSRDGGCLLQGK
jgi:hypothetical protein